MSTTEALSAATSSSTISGAPLTKLLKVSCTLCRQRKVKCDMRKDSCSGCIKAQVECVYIAPLPTNSRKKKVPIEATLARLQRYEEILKSNGWNLEEDADGGGQKYAMANVTMVRGRQTSQEDGSNMKEVETLTIGAGRLIVEHGMQRYVEKVFFEHDSSNENNAKPSAQLPTSTITEDVLIFGECATTTNLSGLHPNPVTIFRLWQTFLDNVNPLVKLFHAPSVQQLILEAAENLVVASKPVEALMFAIYTCAITSLSNEECENMVGESKSTLLARYQSTAQQSLIAAEFLRTSDLVVLQAFVLYLISLRERSDPQSLWTLAGIALRNAQRIGLHRDGGSPSFRLPIFDIEMRRRLWWQIVVLDSQVSKLSGSRRSILASHQDTKIPLNVNDSDLYPSMRELPVEHTGVTEMLFCLIKYEIGEFLHSKITVSGDGGWQELNSASAMAPLAAKERAINELDSRLEKKFLRYCDPLVPLHFLSISMARAFIRTLRIAVHHPRQYPDRGASLSQDEKDLIFSNCVEMFENSILLQSARVSQRFRWHVSLHLPLDPLIYMLNELRYRTTGALVDRAWRVVGAIFERYPGLSVGAGNSLYLSIGNLTLKAWEARAGELARHYQAQSEVVKPQFVALLYGERRNCERPQYFGDNEFTRTSDCVVGEGEVETRNHSEESRGDISDEGIDQLLLYDQLPMELSSMDWEIWNTLLRRK